MWVSSVLPTDSQALPAAGRHATLPAPLFLPPLPAPRPAPLHTHTPAPHSACCVSLTHPPCRLLRARARSSFSSTSLMLFSSQLRNSCASCASQATGSRMDQCRSNTPSTRDWGGAAAASHPGEARSPQAHHNTSAHSIFHGKKTWPHSSLLASQQLWPPPPTWCM